MKAAIEVAKNKDDNYTGWTAITEAACVAYHKAMSTPAAELVAAIKGALESEVKVWIRQIADGTDKLAEIAARAVGDVVRRPREAALMEVMDLAQESHVNGLDAEYVHDAILSLIDKNQTNGG